MPIRSFAGYSMLEHYASAASGKKFDSYKVSYHHRLAEHLWMPQRLTGESLRSGSLIRIIPCMASAFRSATDGLGGDRR
jgi:hypothetical protein